MWLRWLAMLPIVVLPAFAQEATLVRVGETWRYFKGTREASTPATALREAAFDDSSWLAGRSGFRSNDGSYDEATVLDDMISNYVSVFFRKQFVVFDPSTVTWLILRIDYGDGFVACLNGEEIARRNIPGVPGDAVPFDTSAAAARLRGVAEDIDVSAFTGLLRRGPNILAIQAHNVSLSSVPDRLKIQRWIWPVAQRYGVQLIFNGHDHDYERFNPTQGVYNIVAGGDSLLPRSRWALMDWQNNWP